LAIKLSSIKLKHALIYFDLLNSMTDHQFVIAEQ